MYKLLRLTNESFKKVSSNPYALCAWPVCRSDEQHKGSYLAENLSFSERTQDLPSSVSKKDRSGLDTESQALKSDFLKEFKSSSSPLPLEMHLASPPPPGGRSWIPFNSVSPFSQNPSRVIRVCNTDRKSESASNGYYKFYHFKNSSDHIRLYRENITNVCANNHIKKRILQTVGRKPTNEDCKHQVKIEKQCKKLRSNFSFFRLNVSKAFSASVTQKDEKPDQGILRVGPCPGLKKTSPSTLKKKVKSPKDVHSKCDDKRKQKDCTKLHNSQKICRNDKNKEELPKRLCEIVSPQNVPLRTHKRRARLRDNKIDEPGEKRDSLVKQAEKGVRVQLVFFESQPSVEKLKRKCLPAKTKVSSFISIILSVSPHIALFTL